MTHNDSGHFAGKHPTGIKVHLPIQKAVSDELDDRGITCHAAHAIAERLGADPIEVGIAIDLQEGRIRKCQLGLFGYGPAKKIVKQAKSVSAELTAEIKAALVEDRLSCLAAWRIAQGAGISRSAVADACETLNIKISKCQLGAF